MRKTYSYINDIIKELYIEIFIQDFHQDHVIIVIDLFE